MCTLWVKIIELERWREQASRMLAPAEVTACLAMEPLQAEPLAAYIKLYKSKKLTLAVQNAPQSVL